MVTSLVEVLGLPLVFDGVGSAVLRHDELGLKMTLRQKIEFTFRFARLMIGVVMILVG